MDNNEFNAEDARKIVNSLIKNQDLDKILESIKLSAGEGICNFYVHKPLRTDTIEDLRSRGFNVIPQASFYVQRDRLFYIIEWL